jgi:3-hydroxyisobutyrate dehydrogenase-like beta-hydroxyacid dehydrogenase
MTAIALLGTGQMGAPMARRLLATGHRVRVWNRTAARAAPLVAAGAHVAASPADAVGDTEVVITMLTDAAAVEVALFGPAGAAAALRPGTCLVQMSTIGPQAVRDLARHLPDGVDLVDAPVAGSVAAAAAGQLTILAGGEDAMLDRVASVLASLGTVRRCGGVGAGSALKLVLNTALVTALAALADTLAVADVVGVDRAVALEALAGGALGGAVRRATATGASFSVALAGKDLDLARRELGEMPAPVVHAAAQALHAAPDRSADLAALVSKERSCT